MANYMARIELHSATWNDYEVLHASMQRRGFLRIIKSSNGKSYQLPMALMSFQTAAVHFKMPSMPLWRGLTRHGDSRG
jgi:hypothetical protein